jgi:hypothetical protein
VSSPPHLQRDRDEWVHIAQRAKRGENDSHNWQKITGCDQKTILLQGGELTSHPAECAGRFRFAGTSRSDANLMPNQNYAKRGAGGCPFSH